MIVIIVVNLKLLINIKNILEEKQLLHAINQIQNLPEVLIFTRFVIPYTRGSFAAFQRSFIPYFSFRINVRYRLII